MFLLHWVELHDFILEMIRDFVKCIMSTVPHYLKRELVKLKEVIYEEEVRNTNNWLVTLVGLPIIVGKIQESNLFASLISFLSL